MTSLSAWIIALTLAWSAAPLRAEPVPQVFLIQNSGWMLAYYRDPQAKFREFIRDLIATAASDAPRVVVADFNQKEQVQDRGPDGKLIDRASPHLIYDGPYDINRIYRAIVLQLADAPPRKKDQQAWADTDFAGALDRTLNDLLKLQPAVIWIVTNNKFAPSNKATLDKEVLEKTVDFNKKLAGADAIVRLIAMPKTLVAQKQAPPNDGPEFDAKGLVIYGMAYGAASDDALIDAARRLDAAKLGDTRPAMLKPLGTAPVALQLKEIRTVPEGLPWRLNDAKDGLVFDAIPAETDVRLELKGNLSSNYWPQVIESARVVMSWASDQKIEHVPGFEARIDRTSISRMRPTTILEDVTVTIVIPAVPRPQGIAGYFVDRLQIDGRVGLSLEAMQLELDEDFSNKLSGIFGAGSWKQVFLDAFTVSKAGRETPLRVVVEYSMLPLILWGLAILMALLALMGLIVLFARERRYPVVVGMDRVWVSLRPFARRSLQSTDGSTTVVATGRLFGGPQIKSI